MLNFGEALRRIVVDQSVAEGYPTDRSRGGFRRRLLLTSALVSVIGFASPAFSQAINPNGTNGQDGNQTALTGAGGGGGGGGVALTGAASGNGNIIEGGAGGAGGNGGIMIGTNPTSGISGGDGSVNGSPGAGSGGAGGTISFNSVYGAGGTGGGGTAGGAAQTTGTIVGGGGGGGGAAVVLNTAGIYSFYDLITGGAGGAGGSITAQFSGTVISGSGGDGGAGLVMHLASTSVSNVYTITGGAGGAAGSITTGTGTLGAAGNGGVGVLLSGSSGELITSGSSAIITGGAGGNITTAMGVMGGTTGAGGTGLVVSGDTNTITNSGRIKGGTAGYDTNTSGGYGISGGGVVISGDGNTLTNEVGGSITGASRGGFNATGADDGGIGLEVSGNNNLIFNSGNITGGNNGQMSPGDAGANGILISGSGNYLTAMAGLISPGAYNPFAPSASVSVTGNNNTVEIWSPALSIGLSIISTGTGNVFALGGTANGTVDASNFYTAPPASGNPGFSGFTTYKKLGTSTWTVTGLSPMLSTTNWDVEDGTLKVGPSGSTSITSFLANISVLSGAFFEAFIDTGGQSTAVVGDLDVKSGGDAKLLAAQVTGNATVRAGGRLQFNDEMLHGGGGVTGTVTVENSGIIAFHAGSLMSSAPIGTLVLNSASVLDVTLSTAGTPGTAAAGLSVTNLTLDGVVNVSTSGTPATGPYLLISFTSMTQNNTLTVGTHPVGYDYSVRVSGLGVYLDATLATTELYWNGTQTQAGGSSVVGGSGTWSASNTNWTNSSGSTAVAWDGSTAIFAGTSLTNNVTVVGAPGVISVKGMQFDVDGYVISGDSITLAATSGQTGIEVATGATATIGSVLLGTTGLEKTGAGTLVLSGVNTYTGDTTITGGVLQIGSGGATGSVDGAIVNNAALVVNRTGSLTISGIISGSGTLEKQGSGTLTLSGANTYSGTTTVSAGTLEISNVAGLGSTSGGTTVASGATLRNTVLNPSATIAENFTLSGSGATGERGALVNTGRINLSGGILLAGDTTISSDYLTGRRLTLSGIMIGNGTLTLDGGGIMSGPIATTTGGLIKTGDGTWSLQASNGYSGVTTVSAGALSVENDGALGGTASGTVVQSGGTLMLFNSRAIAGEALTLAGDGYSIGYGALTASGSNSTSSWSGAITLSDTASIVSGSQFDTGVSLDLTGGIATAGFTARLGGSSSGTVSSDISGVGGVTKFGEGTWILSAANTYTGTTTVSGGTLRVTDNASLGTTAAGTTVASGATLDLRNTVSNVVIAGEALALSGTGVSGAGALQSTGGSNSWSGAITLDDDSLIAVTAGQLILSGGITAVDKNLTLGGTANGSVSGSIVTGAGTLTKTGTGTWILSGTNTFTGGTTITSGTLQIGNGGTTGSILGNVSDNGQLIFNRSDDVVFAGTISGSGTLTKTGAGTLTLTADNSYAGTTTISGGLLQIGDGGTTGWITGQVITNAGGNSGGIVFNRSDDVTFSATVGGSGTLEQRGPGTLTLGGSNMLSGTTTVSGGTLKLTGSLFGGPVEVKTGGTLLGTSTGMIFGNTTIENGGTLAAASGTSFQMANLTFGATSSFAVSLGAPSTTGAVYADGALTLDGALLVTTGVGFSAGTYRLIDYTGALTNNGMTVTSPAHSLYAIDTATGGQVNLIVAAGQWWNGSTTTGGSSVVGGAGTWNVQAGTTNWTNSAGTSADAWGQGSLAVFAGTGGAVTVSGSSNPQVAGMEFLVDGYSISGGSIELVPFSAGAIPAILVETGATATLSSVLAGSAGLEKTGAGTLIISGTNTYNGMTTISAGTLQIGNGGTTGSINGSIVNNAALAFDRSNDISYYGIISGTGSLEKKGTGTLILAGLNTYTGGTTVSAGTLQIGDGILPLTSLAGNIVNNAALAFNLALNTTFAGTISGTGSLTKLGTNTLTLVGANTYTGGTTVSAGTLQIGTNGTTGQITGDILNNAALVFATNLNDTQTYSDVISGSGTFRKDLGGDLIFTKDQTFTGLTTLTGGQLILGNGGTSGMLAGDVLLNGGSLGFNRSDTATYAGNILSGSSGGLSFNGGGTIILTGDVQTPGSIVVLGGSTAQIGDGTTHGILSGAQAYLADGTLAFNISDSMTADIYITGDGGLRKSGSGTLTLTANNDYGGGTVVAAGTLQIGNGGTTGSVGGAIANSGTVVFDRSDDVTAAGAITGSGSLVQQGAGKLTLVGANSATAGTTVAGGTLEILSGVTLASNIVVQSGGTLQGETSGTSGAAVNGTVSVQDGGTLRAAPTSTAGVHGLSMTSLTLSNSANLDVILGASTGIGVFSAGSLTLDGILNVTNAGAMALGVYRLIDYTTLTADNGLVLGTTPTDFAYTIQVVPNQVNLTVLASTMLYWNGSTTTPDGTIHGGSGTWSASPSNTNWLTEPLNQSRAWDSKYAVFAGAAGDVTVSGTVSTTGMQFMVDGYSVNSGTITLAATSGQPQVRVGDGSAQGAGYVATIGSVLAGTTGLEKTDLGTLILTGTNTYTGNTTVTQGRLQIGNGGTTGVILGDVAVAAGASLAFDRSDVLTFAGVVSGGGSLVQAGSGTLTLTGANTYTGGTTISSGTLQVGDGGISGSLAGDVLNNGALIFNRSNASSFAGAISGTGTLEKSGTGTLTLSGTNSFTGATTVSGGALAIMGGASLADGARVTVGSGATLSLVDADETVGSLAGAGDIALNSHCLTTGGDGTSSSFSGGISGSGCLTKTGAGTMTLSGTSTYTGTTTVSGGAIQVSTAGALGTGPLALEGAGALVASDTFTFARGISLTPVSGSGGGTLSVDPTKTLTVSGVISGTGALTKSGTGTLVLTGANTFSGATNVDAGTLQIGGGASLSDTARLTIAGSAFVNLTDADETIGSLAGAGSVGLNGHCLTAGGDGTSSTFSGSMTGPGCLTKTGDGTLTLTGTNTLTGPTTVSGGALQVSAASALGTGALALQGGGTLRASDTFTYASAISLTPVSGVGGGTFEVDDTKTLTLTGAITGAGALDKTGTGTLVISGANSASGATTVTAGTLIGEGGNALGDESAVSVATGATLILRPSGTETVGSIAGGGTITLDGTRLAAGADNTSTTFSGGLGGTGGLDKNGTGTLTLSGANTYTGATNVNGGTLAVTGSVAGDIYVYNAATLAGTGTVAQTVHVLSGGTLAGVQPTGLTMGGLDMQSGANMNVTLGSPTGGGVFTVNGNVTLDGTLNVTQSPGFGIGIYRIANYTGSLTDNGMDVGTLTGGLLGGVQTSVAGQVNLFVEDPNSPILFWNGTNTTPTQAVLGGSGTWSASSQTNWINASGTIPRAWNGGFAVFQATPGTVTVDNGDGQVSTTGMQFVDSGYVVTGGQLLLTGTGQVTIRVGDGTGAGASSVATIGSVLVGTTGIEKADLGTLVLTGANAYTGGTTISGGTLQLGDGGTTGSILADVVNNGTLAFNLSSTTTFSGVVSGTGSLTQIGTGTLTLNAANTYSGGTVIGAGTLRILSAQALGSGGLTIDRGATLQASGTFTLGAAVALSTAGSSSSDAGVLVDAGQTLTISGVISGGGGLDKTGTGTLVLTGTNSYTGTTTITAGTLQIGNGGTTGSITGNVVNNASLVFNRSDTYAFTGSITGSGAVTFMGGGTVEFSSPYTGTVAVDDSVVRLQAGTTTASPFTVNSGGVLGGTATIGGLTVNSGGTAAPGYSPGTLMVDGAVAFNSGSVYAVDVTPAGAHDLIVATGNVTLSSGATVAVNATPGRYASMSTVAIITTAGTVTGTFGSVTSDYAFLQPTLTYDPQNVYLSLVYTGANFIDYATTPNEANVAVAAQALGNGNPVFEAIFYLPESAVGPAFNQLSGEIYPSVNTVIQQESVYLRDAVGARLRQSVTGTGAGALSYAAKAAGPATAALSQDLTPTLWAQGYGAWGNAFGNGNAASISSSVGGFFAGLDAAIAGNVRAGIVAGFSQTQFQVDARGSSGSMDNYDVGFYLGAQYGALGLRGGVSYTWHDIQVGRTIAFSGFSGSESAGYSLGTTQVFGEAGYRIALGSYELEPFAGLAYVNVSGGSTVETGIGGAGLSVNVEAQSTLYTTLGLRAATSITLGGRSLTPSATLGWQHAFGDTQSIASMQFLSGATPFQVQGVPIAEDTMIVGAGLAYALSDLATIQVNYAGQIASEASQNAFTAQFSLKF